MGRSSFGLTEHFTGILININSLFAPLNDQQLFDDSHAWALPDEEENDADGRHHSFDSLEAVPSTSAVARNRNKVRGNYHNTYKCDTSTISGDAIPAAEPLSSVQTTIFSPSLSN
jgi:hypothetical protein